MNNAPIYTSEAALWVNEIQGNEKVYMNDDSLVHPARLFKEDVGEWEIFITQQI